MAARNAWPPAFPLCFASGRLRYLPMTVRTFRLFLASLRVEACHAATSGRSLYQASSVASASSFVIPLTVFSGKIKFDIPRTSPLQDHEQFSRRQWRNLRF